jgi:hypothetical protein
VTIYWIDFFFLKMKFRNDGCRWSLFRRSGWSQVRVTTMTTSCQWRADRVDTRFFRSGNQTHIVLCLSIIKPASWCRQSGVLLSAAAGYTSPWRCEWTIHLQRWLVSGKPSCLPSWHSASCRTWCTLPTVTISSSRRQLLPTRTTVRRWSTEG